MDARPTAKKSGEGFHDENCSGGQRSRSDVSNVHSQQGASISRQQFNSFSVFAQKDSLTRADYKQHHV